LPKSLTTHQPIVVESAIALDDSELMALKSVLNAKKIDGEITNKVNPNVIGGLKISVGSKVVDLSFNHRLEALNLALGSYEK